MIRESKDNFGRYFDDFCVGEIIKHWPGKTITESDNHLFALLTMNHNPLHIDEHYMEQHQHGKILVVGTYVLSLVVGMSVRDTSGKAIANLEYDSITHDAPVFLGDTIYAESEVVQMRTSSRGTGRGTVHIQSCAFNQKSEKVLTLRRRFLVPKRGN
jgi:acyl dehydratase